MENYLEITRLKQHFMSHPESILVFLCIESLLTLLLFPFTLVKDLDVLYENRKHAIHVKYHHWEYSINLYPVYNFIFIFLSFFFTITTYWFERSFPETSSNQIKFIMLVYSSSASSLTTRLIKEFIKKSVVIPLCITFILYKTINKSNEVHGHIWIMKSKPKFNFHITIFIFIIFLASISNFLLNLEPLQYFEFLDDKFIENNYADPKNITITFPENKKNLIVAIIESMESSFTDPKYGGLFNKNLIPLLTKHALNPKNVHFSHNKMIGGPYHTEGAQWSIGGYMALFAGLPLKPSLRMKGFEPFLPKSKMITDVLKENGYDQYMIFPHLRNFLASGSFFETHGAKVIDTNDIKHNLGKYADVKGGWDFPDYVLYNFTKQFITNISSTGKPFNVMFVTLDTHFPHGSICKLCRHESNIQDEIIQYCADRQASDFINWVQNSPFAHNTTLVVIGDHSSMISNLAFKVQRRKRHTYNLFINSAKKPSKSTKNRKYQTLDIAPTILSAIGANISGNRFALGTDLFSMNKTIGESYGIENVNSILKLHSNFYDNEINDISNDLELTITQFNMLTNKSVFM